LAPRVSACGQTNMVNQAKRFCPIIMAKIVEFILFRNT
jgi:hypothetical protein